MRLDGLFGEAEGDALVGSTGVAFVKATRATEESGAWKLFAGAGLYEAIMG